MNTEPSPSSHIESIEASWNQLLEALSEAAEDFRSENPASDLAVSLETLYESLRGLGSAWWSIRRRFPEPSRKTAPQSASGEEPLPGRAYLKPLAQALVNLGGEARPLTAIREVERIMGDSIRDIDRQRYERSGQIIFETLIRYARQNLKINGLIDPYSTHGLWKLTEAGFKFAKSDREDTPRAVFPDVPGQMTFF